MGRGRESKKQKHNKNSSRRSKALKPGHFSFEGPLTAPFRALGPLMVIDRHRRQIPSAQNEAAKTHRTETTSPLVPETPTAPAAPQPAQQPLVGNRQGRAPLANSAAKGPRRLRTTCPDDGSGRILQGKKSARKLTGTLPKHCHQPPNPTPNQKTAP